jgi:transposase-like protein
MGKAEGFEIRTRMARALREWSRSGKTVRSFAARQGIPAAKFFSWKRLARRCGPARIPDSRPNSAGHADTRKDPRSWTLDSKGLRISAPLVSFPKKKSADTSAFS